MPIHIDELVTNIEVSADDLPLCKEQLEAVISAVIDRLEKIRREGDALRHVVGVPTDARPPVRFRE